MAYEIPMYRFKKDVSFEDAKAMSLSLNGFLEKATGFKHRKTVYDAKQDVWIDFVEWENMDLAFKAMEDFGNSDLCAKFLELADPEFNHMYHGEVVNFFKRG